MRPSDRRRLYIDSRQCRKCLNDYLFPAYGSRSHICNNCMRGSR